MERKPETRSLINNVGELFYEASSNLNNTEDELRTLGVNTTRHKRIFDEMLAKMLAQERFRLASTRKQIFDSIREKLSKLPKVNIEEMLKSLKGKQQFELAFREYSGELTEDDVQKLYQDSELLDMIIHFIESEE